MPAYISSNLTAMSLVLTYHAMVGRVYSSNLVVGTNTTVTTANGQTLIVQRTAGGVTIFGGRNSANVVIADGG